MRRFIVTIVALLIVSGNAIGAWVKVGEAPVGSIYFDSESVRRSGNVVSLTYLFDFKSVQSAGAYRLLSTKTQGEFDCQKQELRTLNFIFYAGNMAAGTPVHSDFEPIPWEPVPVNPNHLVRISWEVACARR